jgi:hypothetical protein
MLKHNLRPILFSAIFHSIRQENNMLGKISVLAAIAVLAFSSGCTMCCHPYDNCGPVFDESTGHPLCSTARAGSILEVKPEAVETSVMEESSEEIPEGRPRPAPSDARPSTIPPSAKPSPANAESEPALFSADRPRADETATVPKTRSTRRAVKQAGDNTHSSIRR